MAHEILGIPVDAAHNPRFVRMAHVYSHMFTNAPPVFKDMWGSYFFEAWALALLILLQVRGLLNSFDHRRRKIWFVDDGAGKVGAI